MSTVITMTTDAQIVSGNDIDLPSSAPEIDQIIAAEIIRTRSAFSISDHDADDIVDALDDHAQADIIVAIDDHAQADIAGSLDDHSLDTQVAVDGAVTNTLGHDATPELETSSNANVSIAGAISTHGAGAAAVTHGAGAAAVAHAASATDVDHTLAGSDPIVSVTATKVDEDTITLDQDFDPGDLLIISYIQVGGRLQIT